MPVIAADAERHNEPFVYSTTRAATDPSTCRLLAALFDADLPWHTHDSPAYQCDIAVVTDLVPPAVTHAVRARLGELLALELADDIHVTAQRMSVGQRVDLHTDHPQLGFEAARFVMYPFEGWTEDHGGVLVVASSAEADSVVARWPPTENSGVAFALAADTFHAVTPVHATRRSVVFNVWHVGNTPAVASAVKDLLDGARFADLPALLDPVIRAAEAQVDESVSYRAALVAWALQRWGLADEVVVRGYEYVLGSAEPTWPVALAAWMVDLREYGFDVARWRDLRAQWASAPPQPPAVQAAGQCCFGG